MSEPAEGKPSPLQQFYRDLAWTPGYVVAWIALDWWAAAGLFVIHWAWNVRRAP